MCDLTSVGTRLTIDQVYRLPISNDMHRRVDCVQLYLDDVCLGIFSRSIYNDLCHLLKTYGNWDVILKETRYLIHYEDRGEYVYLWVDDFTGKKVRRRDAYLIKA